MIAEELNNDRTNGRWTQEEHEKFILGLKLYGRNWKKIEELVATRNGSQIRSHAQKYFLKIKDKLGQPQQVSQNKIADSNTVHKVKEITIKSYIKKRKIPKLSSPYFWNEMSQLIAGDQDFSFWELIECSSPNQRDEPDVKQNIFSNENIIRDEKQKSCNGKIERKQKAFVPYTQEKSNILQQSGGSTNLRLNLSMNYGLNIEVNLKS